MKFQFTWGKFVWDEKGNGVNTFCLCKHVKEHIFHIEIVLLLLDFLILFVFFTFDTRR